MPTFTPTVTRTATRTPTATSIPRPTQTPTRQATARKLPALGHLALWVKSNGLVGTQRTRTVINVVDARTGHLVPGALLTFTNAAPAALRMADQTLRVQLVAQGKGPVSVTVTAPGYVPLRVQLRPAARRRPLPTVALTATILATPVGTAMAMATAEQTATRAARHERGPGLG